MDYSEDYELPTDEEIDEKFHEECVEEIVAYPRLYIVPGFWIMGASEIRCVAEEIMETNDSNWRSALKSVEGYRMEMVDGLKLPPPGEIPCDNTLGIGTVPMTSKRWIRTFGGREIPKKYGFKVMQYMKTAYVDHKRVYRKLFYKDGMHVEWTAVSVVVKNALLAIKWGKVKLKDFTLFDTFLEYLKQWTMCPPSIIHDMASEMSVVAERHIRMLMGLDLEEVAKVSRRLRNGHTRDMKKRDTFLHELLGRGIARCRYWEEQLAMINDVLSEGEYGTLSGDPIQSVKVWLRKNGWLRPPMSGSVRKTGRSRKVHGKVYHNDVERISEMKKKVESGEKLSETDERWLRRLKKRSPELAESSGLTR